MFAIVQVGSSQVKVAEGDLIQVNTMEGEPGSTVDLDKVLMVANGDDIRIGKPFLSDVKISAEIVEQGLGEKVISYKFRRRKHSARKRGYRKTFTALNITKISA